MGRRSGRGTGFQILGSGLGNLSDRDKQVAASEAAKYGLALEAGTMTLAQVTRRVAAAVKADRRLRRLARQGR